jgi:SAM-dependent methyltransferase
VINYDRIGEIVSATGRHYYDKEACRLEREGPLAPTVSDELKRDLSPQMRVLDIGCGSGRTLIELAGLFAEGVGIDNDLAHIELARRNKADSRAANVTFVEGRADNLPFEAESFDVVFSERGPLSGSDINTANAAGVLRAGGTLLTECPGPHNQYEVGYVFEPDALAIHRCSQTAGLEGICAVVARNGIDVRLACSFIETWVFPDVYEWLRYHMSQWDYCGGRRFDTWPLPEELKHGFERFRRMTADEAGCIRVTSHRLWAGGVKH